MMRPAFGTPTKSFKTSDPEEQKLVTVLEREMVQQNPGINWTDIAGKKRLHKLMLYSAQFSGLKVRVS